MSDVWKWSTNQRGVITIEASVSRATTSAARVMSSHTQAVLYT